MAMMPYPTNPSTEWCQLLLAKSYLQNNTQTHAPMLKWVHNLYKNTDNKGLRAMTMEFFVFLFATQPPHQTQNKGCNVENKCKFCKSVEVWSSEYVATLTFVFIRVAKLMETSWAYRNAPKHGNWTTDAMPAGCAHFWAFYAKRP